MWGYAPGNYVPPGTIPPGEVTSRGSLDDGLVPTGDYQCLSNVGKPWECKCLLKHICPGQTSVPHHAFKFKGQLILSSTSVLQKHQCLHGASTTKCYLLSSTLVCNYVHEIHSSPINTRNFSHAKITHSKSNKILLNKTHLPELFGLGGISRWKFALLPSLKSPSKLTRGGAPRILLCRGFCALTYFPFQIQKVHYIIAWPKQSSWF